jgi:hypothetical protein
MQLAGKLKPVMNLEKQVKYRSALEASRNELDSLPTIKKSCDAGRRTPHNNIYAWLDIDGNPILTELHKKGGLPRTKRLKHLETGKIFSNIKDAAQAYGINYNNIQNVCVGSQKTTGKGLVFCYVDDEDNDILTQIHKEYQNEQSENKYKYYAIYPLETDYKTPLAIGKTLKELCDILGLSPSHALEVCKGNRQHDKGYRFTFYDFKEKKPLLFENHKTKLKKVIRNVKCLDDNLEFSNLTEAGKHYGLLSDQIRQCCIGKLKSTGRGRVQRRFAYVDKNGNPILMPKHEESFSWLGTRVFCPELGKTFQSVAEFCRDTGVPQKTARKHLKNPETSLMGLTLIKTGNRHQRR